jgi:TonB-linked SusC/RagA family outer membrane protein
MLNQVRNMGYAFQRIASVGVLLYALVQTPVAAYAQEAEPKEQKQEIIFGKVVDAKNTPLSGVTVSIQGTSVGAITDAQGTFMLRAYATPDARLHLSLLGMKPLTLLIKDRPKGIWGITMQEAEHSMDDVIVTGYQDIKKNELTGSIKQVKAIDIMQSGKLSVDQMLAGQIAGMQVLTSSGEPSATAKIRIRGTSSIVSNKAPLWVLDGIILEDVSPNGPIDYSNLDGEDAAYLIGNAIAGVNPQDIESINVLKDAAATALYGVQAANGVIVVTTKKGREGPPKLSYSGSASVNMRDYYSKLYLMNSAERVLLSKEIEELGLTLDHYPTDIGYEGLRYQLNNKGYFEGKQIASRQDFNDALTTMASRNTDWYDLLFRNAVSHNHTVSLTGGNETTTYYASLGYNQTAGTAIGSESDRYNAMVKLTSWVNRRLYLNFQLSGSITDNAGFRSGANPDNWARTTSRAVPMYNDDGSLFFFETEDSYTETDPLVRKISMNYLNELEETGQTGKVSSLNAKLDLRWNIWDKLRYEFSGSVVSQNSTSESWATEYSNAVASIRKYPYGAVDPGSAEEKSSALPYGGIFSSSNSEQRSYTLRNQLAYEKSLSDDHVLSAQAISEIRSIVTKGFSSTAYGWRKDRGQLISPTVVAENWSKVTNAISKPSITDNVRNYVSWLGFASYAYKGKAMLNGNIRMDGSNQFGDNPKYRFLPVWSISGRYILTEEEFLKGNSMLSYLALRASYGLQGNVDKNTSPDLVARIEPYNSYYHFDMSTIAMLPNPDLRWEKTVSYNAGLDFSLWDRRIAGTMDVYKKMGTDIIMSTQVSYVTGETSVKINAGDMENTGMELDLTGFPVRTKNWELSVNLIYAYNKNVLTKANVLVDTRDEGKSIKANKEKMVNGSALIVGEALGTFYSYRFAGLNHETGLPVFYDNGSATYLNSNGDEVPNYMVLPETADLVKSGVSTPPSAGGVNLSLRYKNLRLRTNFTYSLGGVKRLPNLYNSINDLLDPSTNVSKEYISRWKEPGDEEFTNIPALYSSDAYRSSSAYYKPFISNVPISGRTLYDRSDLRVASTDNIRLNSVTLSYLFHDKWVEAMHVSDVMLSLQVTNLFLIAHKEWHGRDPEQSASANASLPKTFTLNLNINF